MQDTDIYHLPQLNVIETLFQVRAAVMSVVPFLCPFPFVW